MRALETVSGVQSLRSITARSSSARVLDLHSLSIEAADDPDHGLRPMFTHPLLNRTIVVKHHPRAGEFDYASDRGAIATKVIFPFDPANLDLGGQFLMVDDPDLPELLARHLDYADYNIGHDLSVLRLFDNLPTLDPFLLYEALAAHKHDVAPCYFRLSAADKSQMLEFVSQQVETLIGLCFAGPGIHGAQAKRLSELLLGDGDSPELDPLRQAMRMEAPEFARAIFCWKAVLYYRWRSRTLGPELKATHRAIQGVSVSRFDADSRKFVKAATSQLDTMVRDAQRRIAEMFRIYDEVFEALTEQRSPEPFRRFLIDGPRLFARLGERMGRLEQLTSYWLHQFPDRRTSQLSPEVVFDGLRNILAALSLQAAADEGDPEGGGRRVVWRTDDLDVEAAPKRERARQPAAG